MSKKALENVEKAECATVAKDEDEKNLAVEFLKEIEKYHTKDAIVKSLTIPRGEEYLESALVRFLRARNGNITKAVKMVNEAMAFRKNHDVDNILKKPLPKPVVDHLNRSFYQGYLPKYDTYGRPVFALRGGACGLHLSKLWNEKPEDFEEWAYADLEDAFVHYHLILIEYLTTVIMPDATKSAGKLINKYVVVDDLSGFTVRGALDLCHMIGLFRRTTVIDQLLYPELLGGLFFLNAPQVFQKPWALVKHVIDPKTRTKIFMLGGEKSYKAILDKGFPKETLPVLWGGTDSGHHISEFENPRPEVFEKMYKYTLDNAAAKNYADLRKNALKVEKILPKSEKIVRKTVPPNSILEYEISVDGHDIEYSVTFEHKSNDSDTLESISLEHPARLESSAIRHHGQYGVSAQYPNGGDVVIKLCNKYSIVRSKTVYHRIIHYPIA
uniref:CRAL-TRIO domain-containing protein n=1 Tax=Aplanochytrium stocchinoi TaxID=215587 RepID=A0A7S3PNF9_9STRA|mmetsp:Transcript_18940/g.23220  ORF Transcript_18940/g.23220 Transcript_18940/m.23220 type:complete len:441 (+) Transcript_18940:167-1489(+)